MMEDTNSKQDTKGVQLQLSSDALNELRSRFDTTEEEIGADEIGENIAQTMTTTKHCICLPLILIDTKRLTGYHPEDEDQRESMRESLRAIIFEDEEKGQERLADMLQAGQALHGDTTRVKKDPNLLSLPYPECIGPFTTRTIWSSLLQRHSIPVVNRLQNHLRVCHRPLVWKYLVLQEIRNIVKSQERRKVLVQWKSGRRGHELNRLYMVRATMQHRCELAAAERDRLLKEREVLVDDEMGTSKDLGIAEYFVGQGVSDDDEEDDYEPYVYQPDDWDAGPIVENQSDCEGENNFEATRLAWEAEDEVRDSIQEKLTTDQLRKSIAKASALEHRLAQVDDLLESLQDEEWAEDEESTDDDLQIEFDERKSVLHPIMAMILGALDFRPTNWLQHQNYVVNEHHAIVAEWKNHFGELPPPLPSKEEAIQEERERLGIKENCAEEWDL